ncbi:MAG: surface glycoprotein [Clostridia bacterium]|nr:surface glycoprotein [Clostridia bacterium]
MQKTIVRKPISVLLSLLMVLSVFGGMAFNASAADPHTHAFTYTASGNTITATCSVEGCDLPDGKVTLTIADPENKYYDDNESSHHFTLEGLEAFNSATGKAISVNDLVYYKGDNQSSDIKNNRVKGATYKAKLTVEGKTAEHSFQFTAKPKPHTHSFTYSASGAVITATCKGTDGTCDLLNKQATLTIQAPACTVFGDGNSVEATIEGEIPGVTAPSIRYAKGSVTLGIAPRDAGTYSANITLGSANASVTYTINKADTAFTTLPAAKTLTFTGEPQALVTEGAAAGGQIAYTAILASDREPDTALGDMPYTYSVPEMVNAGTYDVWYRLDGGKNYNSIPAQKITVTIAQAEPTYEVPADLSATYGDTLADVALPEGWTWQAPTASVGNAGANAFAASYTPADSNYATVHDIEVTVTVAPKPITVTADAITKKCGQDDPALTYSAPDLLAGDTLSGELVRAAGEEVGAYAITGELSNSNYAITFVPGVFTIEHDIVKVQAKEASCSEDGNIEHYRCTGCGKVFKDAAATEEMNVEDTVIPAHGHDYDGSYCSICGKFRCDFCERYEAWKDIPYFGWVVSLVHLFVHMAAHISSIT